MVTHARCALCPQSPGPDPCRIGFCAGVPGLDPASKSADFRPHVPGDPRVRVGFLCDTRVKTGGTETWHDTLYRTIDASRLRIVGMAAHGVHGASPLPDGSWAAEGVEGMRRLARAVDVLVTWGIGDLKAILPENGDPARPFVAAVCHGEPGCPYTRRWVAACATQVDRFGAVSEATRATIPGSHRDQALVVPNAFDRAKVRARTGRAEVRAALGIASTAFLALYNGRLAADKRPMLAVEAMRHAAPGAVLAVAGSGGLEGPIREAAEAMPGRVIVLGHRQDTADLLHAADLLVNPSDVEGFGLSMLEAVVAGLAVAATPRGLPAIHPGWFRIVDHDGGAEAWAGAIDAEMADLAGAKRRAEIASVEASALYAPEAFGRAWSDAILGWAASRPRPVPARTTSEIERLLTLAHQCPDRGGRVSCQRYHCRDREEVVHLSACIECVRTREATHAGAR